MKYDSEMIDRVMLAIHNAHSQIGDDNCWMDIDKIFIAAGLSVPNRTVGNKDHMLRNCSTYIDTMCNGGEWKSYQELLSENAHLKATIEKQCHARPQ